MVRDDLSVRRRLAAAALLASAALGAAVVARAVRRPEEPGAVVARFFAAVERRDCDAAKKLVAGELGRSLARPDGCQAFFDEYASHRVKFGGALAARADGRDANARIVDARISMNDHERTQLLRVERARADSAWRMTRF